MLEESELILTPEGCIYHLNLHPEEIADTIVTVGDPRRVKEVSKYFDSIEIEKENREFITHTGYIGKKRITAISTGISSGNIDIVMNELDALVNIDFNSRTEKSSHKSLKIIRLGTAGALQQEIEVDSFVVTSFGIGMDNLLHYYKQEYNAEESYILNDFENHTMLHRQSVRPYIAEGAIQLRHKFIGQFIHGITVTCPGFFGPQGRKLRLPMTFPNLIDKLSGFKSSNHFIANFEMETAAIYGLGKLLGHQCISISNIINNRHSKTFSKNPAAAVSRMIKQCLEIIIDL